MVTTEEGTHTVLNTTDTTQIVLHVLAIYHQTTKDKTQIGSTIVTVHSET